MNIKYFKNLLFFIIFILISNCGYQPLLTDKNQFFSVNSFNILGDKKLGQALANKFNKIEAAENNLTLEIKALISFLVLFPQAFATDVIILKYCLVENSVNER